MRKDIVSIVLGIIAMLLGFCPIIALQLVGAVVGVVGAVLARQARREDYRRDLTSAVGMVASIAGIVLCLLTPVVFLVGRIVLLIAG